MSTPFDAGNDFATSAKEAVAEALATPEAPVAQGSEAPVEAAPALDTWDDKPQADATEAPAVPAPSAAPTKLKVKGAKGEHEFELSADNERLKQTLAMGLGAGKWKQERDDAAKELARLKAEIEQVRGKASATESVQALAQRGHYEQAVRKALGDEAYQKFVASMAQEFDDYTSGDPERRAAIEGSRRERTQRFKDEEAEARVRAATERLEALESKIETDRLHTIGTRALQQHDFRGYVKDSDQAHALNQKLWRLAWSELEDQAESGQPINDAMVARVFADNAKVLQTGLTRQVEERVTKVMEQKKADAKSAAQVVATERYPKATPDLSGWDGRSSKDLLKRLVGRG
jgi:hypothetical protein